MLTILTGLGADELLTGGASLYTDPRVKEKIGRYLPKTVKEVIKILLRKKQKKIPWLTDTFIKESNLIERQQESFKELYELTTNQTATVNALKNSATLYYREKESLTALRAGASISHPFLELDLVTLCLNAPADLLNQNGFSKYLLRAAFKETAIQDICWRSQKVDYGELFARKLQMPEIQTLFPNLLSAKHGWVDSKIAIYYYEKTIKFYTIRDLRYQKYLFELWNLVSVEVWLRTI